MKSAIVGILLMFVALGASANGVSVNGLTAQQAAQIEAQIAQLKAENTKSPNLGVEIIQSLDAESLNRYSELASVITQTVTDTAKGLGMAVDEFMQTTTGTAIMFLIIYHFFGSDLIIFTFGVLFLIPFTIYMGHRIATSVAVRSYTLNEKGKKVPVFVDHISSDARFGMAVIRLATVAAVCIQFAVITP